MPNGDDIIVVPISSRMTSLHAGVNGVAPPAVAGACGISTSTKSSDNRIVGSVSTFRAQLTVIPSP